MLNQTTLPSFDRVLSGILEACLTRNGHVLPTTKVRNNNNIVLSNSMQYDCCSVPYGSAPRKSTCTLIRPDVKGRTRMSDNNNVINIINVNRFTATYQSLDDVDTSFVASHERSQRFHPDRPIAGILRERLRQFHWKSSFQTKSR